MSTRLSQGFWVISALLSAGIAVYSYRYFLEMGPHAPPILGNPYAKPFLYLHISGAATALLLGPLNFVTTIRRRQPQVHRWVGRIYITGCLLGGAGGLTAAFGSTAGPVATSGFGLLAIFWIAANVQGWLMARSRRFADHRAWMIRSFAMTFAAVTLRLYLPLIPLFHVSFVDGYRAISFLAWIPNLVVAELYIRGAFGGLSRPARVAA